MTLNEQKCIFEFVSFRLSAEGLGPLHSKVHAVPPKAILPGAAAIISGDDSLIIILFSYPLPAHNYLPTAGQLLRRVSQQKFQRI